MKGISWGSREDGHRVPVCQPVVASLKQHTKRADKIEADHV